MPLPPHPVSALRRTTRQQYTDRIQAVADGPDTFNILIDGQLRFRLEGESQWPAQWRLYATTDGARAAQCLAIENEYWDIVYQLECGVHWMPIENIRPVTRGLLGDSTYASWPEYLRER